MISQAWALTQAELALRLLVQARVQLTEPIASGGGAVAHVGSTELFRPVREWPPQYPYRGIEIPVTVADPEGDWDTTIASVNSLTEAPLTDWPPRDFPTGALIGLRPSPLPLGPAGAVSLGTPWTMLTWDPDRLPAINVRGIAGERRPEEGGQAILRQSITAEIAYARAKHTAEQEQVTLLAECQALLNLLHTDLYLGGAGTLWVLGWGLDEMTGGWGGEHAHAAARAKPYAVATVDVLVEVQRGVWS
ncbi:hypothetical protein ES703_26475 [subsurface metagenome]